MNSLFAHESRSGKQAKQNLAAHKGMQNFALLAILSSLILSTIFATESMGCAKMSVEGIFRLYVKSKFITLPEEVHENNKATYT